MRKPCLFVLFCCYSIGLSAQDLPKSETEQVLSLSSVQTICTQSINPEELRNRDERLFQKPGPNKFAEPEFVTITPDTHGTWEHLDTGRLWRLVVDAPGAMNLNFGFNRFKVPDGVTLFIHDTKGKQLGPYTLKDNHPSGQLWTPVLTGNRAVLEMFVPTEVEFEPELILRQISRGYMEFAKADPKGNQGRCNIDVVCPEGDPWRNEIRSVARYVHSGVYYCTGNLVNNTAQDGTPYFLTAYHCGVNQSNQVSVIVYWNYESPVCGQLGGGSLSDITAGSTFLVSNRYTDMALLQLDEVPPAEYNVFYSGWDRRWYHTPMGSVGIHHPKSYEKAISFNDDPLSIGRNCILAVNTVDTHWYVDNWEQGTTEKGSSGSGLWDPDSHMLVGYLSGGLASCSDLLYDCYGRFSEAWDVGLSEYLDPDDTGMSLIAGMDPNITVFELENGVAKTALTGEAGSLHHFLINVRNGANLNIRTSGGTGDVDLYVKRRNFASEYVFDCKSSTPGNVEHCRFYIPTGTYFIALKAVEAFEGVSMTASYVERVEPENAPSATR